MNSLPLTYEGDPVLKTVCSEVTVFDDELKEFSEIMLNTMRLHDGVGLAAPQVGSTKRIIVTNFEPFVFVNPVISEGTGKQKYREGCLSFPDLFLDVDRYQHVRVEYNDLEGNDCWVQASGRDAVIMQHEIDHLNGIVFTTRVNSMALMLAYKKQKW